MHAAVALRDGHISETSQRGQDTCYSLLWQKCSTCSGVGVQEVKVLRGGKPRLMLQLHQMC